MSSKRKKPGLSLCMIVRDEQDMLPEFLSSTVGLWDELCVVDTGSVDSTVAILIKAGARVDNMEWQDDFAAARNMSLDMANHEWIMFLDADERPGKELIGQVRHLLDLDDAGAATVKMINRLPHGHVRQTALLRIFRNEPGIRFFHSIHEDVSESVAAYLKQSSKELVHLNGKVEHLGYVRQRALDVDKRNRDERLLRRCIHADSGDWYSRFKLMELARFWSDSQLWRKSANDAYHALDAGSGLELDGRHFAGEFVALMAQGMYPDSPTDALRVLNRWPHEDSAAYLMARGMENEKAGKAALAMADYSSCLRLPMASDEQLTGVRPLLGLSRIAMMAERLSDAHKLAKKALENAPCDPEAIFAVVSLTRMREGQKGVERFRREYERIFGDSIELHSALGEDALMAGFPRKAILHFESVLDVNPEDVSARLGTAQAMLSDNRILEASTMAKSMVDQWPGAWMGVLVCDLVMGRDSDIQVDMSLDEMGKALRPWVDAVRSSPYPRLKQALIQNAPALEHVFSWLPGYLAA